MTDDRVIPFGRSETGKPEQPSQMPFELFIPAMTAGVNAQNLPVQLHNLGLPAAEAAHLEELADAFVAQLRRHLSPEIDQCWPPKPQKRTE